MPKKRKETEETALPRMTGEIVLKNQLRLEEWIKELIKENRTLTDGEGVSFTSTYRRATLGLGAYIKLNTGRMPGADHRTLDEIVLVHLSKSGEEGMVVGWGDTDEKWKVRPADLWGVVLNRLKINVFGEALQRAIVLSPEKYQRPPTSGFAFRPGGGE